MNATCAPRSKSNGRGDRSLNHFRWPVRLPGPTTTQDCSDLDRRAHRGGNSGAPSRNQQTREALGRAGRAHEAPKGTPCSALRSRPRVQSLKVERKPWTVTWLYPMRSRTISIAMLLKCLPGCDGLGNNRARQRHLSARRPPPSKKRPPDTLRCVARV
jgi:hypothetical protein